MARIAGVDLQPNKRTDIALTYIYGIGRNNVAAIIKSTEIDASKRIKDLTEEEVNRLQKYIEKNLRVEGDLRQEIQNNIKRLRVIGAYRGIRHVKKLPVHGQRTRSNARTKRGKRMTIGALKKDDRVKMTDTAGTSKTAAPAKTEKK